MKALEQTARRIDDYVDIAAQIKRSSDPGERAVLRDILASARESARSWLATMNYLQGDLEQVGHSDDNGFDTVLMALGEPLR